MNRLQTVETATKGPRIGESAIRPDGIPKVKGEFVFSNDLRHPDMLWGGTLRSPHPSARIVSINTIPALKMTGVHAVLTSEDLSGMPLYGLEHPDQPVLADGVVRYQGEPIAIVAADHPENARLALEAIEVEYELIEPLSDSELAQENEAIHPDGNLFWEINLSYGNSQEEEEGEEAPHQGLAG